MKDYVSYMTQSSNYSAGFVHEKIMVELDIGLYSADTIGCTDPLSIYPVILVNDRLEIKILHPRSGFKCDACILIRTRNGQHRDIGVEILTRLLNPVR